MRILIIKTTPNFDLSTLSVDGHELTIITSVASSDKLSLHPEERFDATVVCDDGPELIAHTIFGVLLCAGMRERLGRIILFQAGSNDREYQITLHYFRVHEPEAILLDYPINLEKIEEAIKAPTVA